MKFNILTILLLSFSVSIISCKKKDTTEPKDTEAPNIYVVEPYSNHIYPKGITVSISGSVTDNIALSLVDIKVHDTLGDTVFEHSFQEADFALNARTTHHGEHNLVDVNSVTIDTFFVAPSTAGNLTLSIFAADKEGNTKDFEREIDVR